MKNKINYPTIDKILSEKSTSATQADGKKVLQLIKKALPVGVKAKLVGSLTKKTKGKDIDILLIIDPETAPEIEDEPFWWKPLQAAGLELEDPEAVWDNPKTDERIGMEAWSWKGIPVDLFFEGYD